MKGTMGVQSFNIFGFVENTTFIYLFDKVFYPYARIFISAAIP
jgi:hypothetical protein